MRTGHPSLRVSGVAVGRNRIFHHEGHEEHEGRKREGIVARLCVRGENIFYPEENNP
jgi:hypothetical protein